MGITHIVTTPVSYTASTKVLVDENLNRILNEVNPGPALIQSDSAIASQIEVIKSLRLATSVVEELKLHQNDTYLNPPTSLMGDILFNIKQIISSFVPKNIPPPSVTDTVLSEAASEKLLIKKLATGLQQTIKVERVVRSYVILIEYESHDPELASLIANAYANAYLIDQLQANFEATKRATTWLQGQLNEISAAAQKAALEAERFRTSEGLAAARGQLISEQQVSELNTQLSLARAETARTEARYTQLQDILKNERGDIASFLGIFDQQDDTSIIVDIKTRLSAATKREKEVAEIFGSEHSQAIALRKEKTELTNQVFLEIKSAAEEFKRDFEVAKAREEALDRSVQSAADVYSVAIESQVELKELEQRAEALSTLHETFLSRYEELSREQTFPIGKVRVITEATTPLKPSAPSKTKALAIALILGLMLGASLAGLSEFNERYFRTGNDVRDRFGLKFMGYAPAIKYSEAKKIQKLLKMSAMVTTPSVKKYASEPNRSRMFMSVVRPTSYFTETVRNIKVACDVFHQKHETKIIGMISVLPGEGKSTLAANFANLIANSGHRTLLIDADLRNAGLSNALGFRPEQSLAEAIITDTSLKEMAVLIPESDLLFIPTSVRRKVTHTSEFLSSPEMKRFLDRCKNHFEYIIMDTPPFGPLSDAKTLAPLVDSFIVVTHWGATPRSLIRTHLMSEPSILNKVAGVVLNKVAMKKLGKYSGLGAAERHISKYYQKYLNG